MTKENLVRKMVNQHVWGIFKKVYNIGSDNPTSDNQQSLLDKMSEYVYDSYASKMSVTSLKAMLKEVSPVIDEKNKQQAKKKKEKQRRSTSV
jgi:hypothetical protein